MRGRTLTLICAASLLGGCFVVSSDHRDQVEANAGMDTGVPRGEDGGPPNDDGGGQDAGPGETDGGSGNILVDRCGDPDADYEVLRDSEPPFIVDTRDLVSRIGSCGTGNAPGNDGFLAVEVTAGDLWHFHVIPDPGTPDQVRDPFLYLVLPEGSSCDTRACQHFSNACIGGGDEHFAFVAPEDGIWYLGIDDAMPGGGVYQIEAIRLQCGDGTKVHGEACDETGANCNSTCQQVLSETRSTEVEANDNPIEANFVEIPAATNSLTLSGNIGGNSCNYPDVFNFRVPTAGTDLAVDILKSDGTICDNGSLTPFDIVLRDAAGEVRAAPMTNPTTGCAELRVSGLSASSFFLYLEHDAPIDDRIVTYNVRITLTPP